MRKLGTAAAAMFAVAAMTMALAASAQAAITLGQLAPNGAKATCDTGFDAFQFVQSNEQSYEVPDDGVITSWSINNTETIPNQTQMMTFKLFGSASGNQMFKVLAHDGPHALTAGLNTFKVHIPVSGGEVIGLNTANANNTIQTACLFAAGDQNNDSAFIFVGNGADGATIGPPNDIAGATRVNVSATLFQTPDINTFSRVKLGSIAGGGRVTLEGNHFEEVEKVTFGGVLASGIKELDDHHVSVVAPKGKTLRGIAAAVTTPGGTVTSTPFFFYSGCQVPKLAGKTLAAAKSRLKGAGCKLGRVSKVAGRHGKVVGQSPGPGKVLAPGAKVSVKIGR